MGKEYGGGGVFVVRKEYGQKCELGTKIVPCAIIYTGGQQAPPGHLQQGENFLNYGMVLIQKYRVFESYCFLIQGGAKGPIGQIN